MVQDGGENLRQIDKAGPGSTFPGTELELEPHPVLVSSVPSATPSLAELSSSSSLPGGGKHQNNVNSPPRLGLISIAVAVVTLAAAVSPRTLEGITAWPCH
ncbi:hypothetical protein NW754_004339 [Fusarium falciforme]|nr:hypothetical protein NW754_004339 [Fusarium falciforme]